MLSGELTGLRARAAEDVGILHAELYEDVAIRVRADTRPWKPIPVGPASPYWVPGLAAEDPSAAAAANPGSAMFSVVELATGELVGEALLWAIDLHNRSAHIGISLRPAFRGRGYGADVVRILCRYGFRLRGLYRLQLETLGDNHAMMAVAEKVGFTREGTTRGSSWVNGRFYDDVIFGLLAEEFTG
ncbi:MAG: GNAT family protein [Trebonia sp.]|jgi:RimJ/RimL family protein N-acetyltransferase